MVSHPAYLTFNDITRNCSLFPVRILLIYCNPSAYYSVSLFFTWITMYVMQVILFYLWLQLRNKSWRKVNTSKSGGADKHTTRRKQPHEKGKKSKQGPIKCPFCPKKTTSDLHLILHYVAKHNQKTSAKEPLTTRQSVSLVHA